MARPFLRMTSQLWYLGVDGVQRCGVTTLVTEPTPVHQKAVKALDISASPAVSVIRCF